MTSLAQILEGDDFVPAPPAADTSAFGGPSGPTGGPPVGGSFVDDIAEQIFAHLDQSFPGVVDTPAMVTEVDKFLAQLREQLVAV